MNDKEHNQRLLRAALVSFLVLTAWTFLFPPKKPVKKRPAATSTEQAAETTKTSSPSVAAIQVATSSPTAVAMPVVKPEFFHFAGQVKPSKDEDAIPFELSLTNVGGGIDRFILPGFKERTKDNTPSEEPISLAESVEAEADLSSQMAGVEFGEGTTFSVPLRPVYEVVSSGETKNGKSQVQYRYRTPEGVVVEREYRLDPESFELELAVTIKNNSPQPQRHALRLVTAQRLTPVMEAGGMLFMPPADQLNAACYTDEKVERDLHKELLDEPKSFSDGVKWVGTDRQYFLASVILRDDVEAKCRLEAKGKLARATLQLPETTLRPGEEKRHKFTAYIGVKKPGLLTRVDSQLEAAIDYTILGLNLAPVCQLLLWILAMIHGLSGSWGVAILGLTVLVKLALFPLNQRSGKSMRAMSALKPQIDELKEKYPEDKQRQSEEMMKLYRDNNVNPASGCVPMLLQMPIWFALYRALWVSVDLFQQPFLWIPDLTAQDPLWILPVILVLVMFVQQKMTPTTMDAAQQKMMQYFMPLMFGFMMAALPAGLCFYIFVNTVLTIVQQHLINKSVGPIARPSSAPGATA